MCWFHLETFCNIDSSIKSYIKVIKVSLMAWNITQACAYFQYPLWTILYLFCFLSVQCPSLSLPYESNIAIFNIELVDITISEYIYYNSKQYLTKNLDLVVAVLLLCSDKRCRAENLSNRLYQKIQLNPLQSGVAYLCLLETENLKVF